MLDRTSGKKARAQKVKKVDELGREENLSLESRTVLQGLAKTFLESCFNRALLTYAPWITSYLLPDPMYSIPILRAQGYQGRATQDHGER